MEYDLNKINKICIVTRTRTVHAVQTDDKFPSSARLDKAAGCQSYFAGRGIIFNSIKSMYINISFKILTQTYPVC